MNELIPNSSELIHQMGESAQKPAVKGLFTQMQNWLGKLKSKNTEFTTNIEKAKQQNDIAALHDNLKVLEQWNKEMHAELEEKAKEVDSFVKNAGFDKNVAGSKGTSAVEIDSVVKAISMLKKGTAPSAIHSQYPSLPIDWIEKIDTALKS